MTKGRQFMHVVDALKPIGTQVSRTELEKRLNVTPVSTTLDRLSTYLYDIEKFGGEVERIKDGRNVIAYILRKEPKTEARLIKGAARKARTSPSERKNSPQTTKRSQSPEKKIAAPEANSLPKNATPKNTSDGKRINFTVWGPFKLFCDPEKKYQITKDSGPELAAQLDSKDKKLADSHGCYMFALRAGKGYTPWYLGKASKSSLAKEAMNFSNILSYNGVINSHNGTPVLFVIAHMTPGRKFHKKSTGSGKNAAIDFLENWLIGKALEKNHELINRQQTNFLKNLRVDGIFNARKGKPPPAAKELHRVLFSG